jgi:hypothetical protein
MEKKVLEMYVSPALQVVELKVNSTLLVGSFNPDDPKPGDDEEF